jgi:hypothetical protein
VIGYHPANPPTMPEYSPSARSALDSIVGWLVFDTSPVANNVELLQCFAERLCGIGLDLLRMVVQARPLSPQASTLLYVWRPAERAMEISRTPRARFWAPISAPKAGSTSRSLGQP